MTPFKTEKPWPTGDEAVANFDRSFLNYLDKKIKELVGVRDLIRHDGHVAFKRKLCDVCGSQELKPVDKTFLKCLHCGKLYSKKHEFRTGV